MRAISERGPRHSTITVEGHRRQSPETLHPEVREETTEPITPQEQPPAPMDVQETFINPETQENSATFNMNNNSDSDFTQTNANSAISREEHNALFERELARIDEELGLRTMGLEQPHTTIEKVAQLTSALADQVQESHDNVEVSARSDTMIYITTTTNGVTSEPFAFTPTWDELLTCETAVVIPPSDNTSGVQASTRIPKWKKRACHTMASHTVPDNNTNSNISMCNSVIEEDGEDVEEPLTKKRNTGVRKNDMKLSISAEAAEQPRREL
ncbi:hypothetical protein FCV25MIE_07224 [Fagus crenata]